MAIPEPAPGPGEGLLTSTSNPSSVGKANPFASAQHAAVAADVSPFALRDAQEPALTVRAPRSTTPPAAKTVVRKVSFSQKLFSCACVRPAVQGDDDSIQVDASSSLSTSSNTSSLSDVGRSKAKGVSWDVSPKRSLMKQSSCAYTDVDWFDARSEFSSVLGGAQSDQIAKLEELSLMIRDLAPAPPTKAPWIPEPALAFAQGGLTFMPVPAHTGFAAYWERDHERSTSFPTPIDKMTKASTLAQKSHASIPGIWLQETDTSFTVTVKPGFMPPGLPRYTETYDKSMDTEPSWSMRRDLRLGSTSGQIFMTTDGMLILRARSRPMFGSIDYVMEEYMRLEEGGQVIVDRMCCLEVKSGNTATQYVVGHRHAVPPRGHV